MVYLDPIQLKTFTHILRDVFRPNKDAQLSGSYLCNSGAGHANPLASVKVSAEGAEVTGSFAQADRIMANKINTTDKLFPTFHFLFS
jgi:hypothetical protein